MNNARVFKVPENGFESISQEVHGCFSPIVSYSGAASSCQILFFDKDDNYLYKFPVLNAPLNTNGRATMLLINKLADSDPRVETIIFATALQHPKHGNMLMSHTETRANQSTTLITAHDIADFKITDFSIMETIEFMDDDFEPVFYGFFEKPEKEISRLKWEKVMKNIRIVSEATSKRVSISQSINTKATNALGKIYSSLIRVVEHLPDQPRLKRTR